MLLKKLIQDTHNSSLSIYNYMENVPPNQFLLTGDIMYEINAARLNKDDSLLECILVIASRDGLDSRYTKILCELLEEDWHFSHEDIVMMLEEIKDPASTSTIYETALKIPDYDDGRSLAKKCIWALGAINTPEAKKKLDLLKSFDDPIISEAAAMELQHTANLH